MDRLTVLYGSQTGNTEDLARRFGYMCRSCGLENIIIKQMDDYVVKDLIKEKFLVFLCSTTGHGQEPENMHRLFNFMRRRDLPKDCLGSLNCAVFGVGDSSYTKFNWVAKILFRRLKYCGAQTAIDLVLGDEKHPYGCDAEIYPAFDRLFRKLKTFFPSINLNGNSTSDFYKLPVPSYRISNRSNRHIEYEEPFGEPVFEKYGMRSAFCIGNDRLTPETHFQDTRLIKLEPVDSRGLDFKPGDVCAIHPANNDESVDEFIRIFDLDPDMTVCLEKRFSNFMINYLYDFLEVDSRRVSNVSSTNTTSQGVRMRDVIKYYLDINSVPRRSFFEILANINADSLESGKLKEFSSNAGQGELYDYCTRPKRTILEVLLDFPQTVPHVKLDYLFDLIPPIKPRSFSIASCVAMYPKELHLLVAVVKYKTRLVKPRLGLCSNYLAQLKPNEKEKVYFCTKSTSFKMIDYDRPLIMIGPGTGVAPFRSFLQEKKILNSGNNYLFFGCRFRDSDFYFKSEWNELVADNLLQYHVAVSRDTPKQYIQDVMLEKRDQLYDLIVNKGGYIYVAGNSKLPEALRGVLRDILNISKDETVDEELPLDQLVSRMEQEARIQYDCW